MGRKSFAGLPALFLWANPSGTRPFCVGSLVLSVPNVSVGPRSQAGFALRSKSSRANPSGTRADCVGPSASQALVPHPGPKQDSPTGRSRPAPTALNPKDSTTYSRSPDQDPRRSQSPDRSAGDPMKPATPARFLNRAFQP